VILPAPTELLVEPIERNVAGVVVSDTLTIERQGSHQVKITFVNVAPTTETYKWQIMNIKNPPSTQPSSRFTSIVVMTGGGALIQSFQ